jgi:hypothetical protein
MCHSVSGAAVSLVEEMSAEKNFCLAGKLGQHLLTSEYRLHGNFKTEYTLVEKSK